MEKRNLRQRGGALLQAIMIVGGSLSLITLVVQQTYLRQQMAKLEEQKTERASLARRLGSQLTNPTFLLESTNDDTLSSENRLLRQCLGKSLGGSLNEYETPLTATDCNFSSFSEKTGIPFALAPDASFTFNASSAGVNCPGGLKGKTGSRPVSCFMAGPVRGAKVGYNLKGDISTLGPNYPFEAKTFFYPQCEDTSKKVCPYASVIKLRYEMTQHLYDKGVDTGKTGHLGTFPVTPTWVSLDTISIMGSQCNTGAKVTGQSQTGFLSCMCTMPYKPKLGPNGKPMVNAKGPVCETMERMCPNGLMLVGRNSDGSPMCEMIRGNTAGMPVQFFGTYTNFNTVNCATSAVGGWVYKVDKSCYSYMNFVENECPDGCGACLTCVLIGALIAQLIAGLILLAIAAILNATGIGAPAGLAVLVSALVLIGAIAGGAVAGYIFGESWDWIFADAANGVFPQISCTYRIYCASIRY